MNRARAYFAIIGDGLDPDLISRRVGLDPTSTWRQGEDEAKSRALGRPVPRRSKWEFSGPEAEGDDVDVYRLSSALIAALSHRTDEIAAIAAEEGLEAVLEVVLYISADERISTPAIGFAPEVIAFLAKVGASIDVDTYRC